MEARDSGRAAMPRRQRKPFVFDRGELSSGPGATAMRCRVQRFGFVGFAAITKLARVTWIAAFMAAAPAVAAEMAVKAPAPLRPADDRGRLYVGRRFAH